ncbi:hypothetical protein MLD38_008436 [Melastoma candidum]|uniref:Uncharacterized protein n=1 Tax=Melastoma candidum TaxID=119954 RepID=A0ACB9RXE2_9MYRT|nr:hypothetical protein MLD38_008436 [Melastoma candidum]
MMWKHFQLPTITEASSSSFPPSLSSPSHGPGVARSQLARAKCLRPTASDKLLSLVSEFRSLQEPVQRVKRLLDYAASIPPFEEGARRDSNRVRGCASQVWLDVGMDRQGRMRFRADSDSEITKGFCSCLIHMLDEAEPDEVMGVRAEDLRDVNVGIVVHSRVNTWQNVLVSMQSRTQELVTVAATADAILEESSC